MAHTKAGGSGMHQGVNVAGKRLGVKKFGGQKVKPGDIIIRQRGTVYYPGEGVKLGRDFTIYSVTNGFVYFRRMTGQKRGKYWVDVLEKLPSKAIKSQVTSQAPAKDSRKKSEK